MRLQRGAASLSAYALAGAAASLVLAAGTRAAQAPQMPAAPPQAAAPEAAAPPRPRYPPIDTSRMMLEDPEHQRAGLPGWAYIPVRDPARPLPPRVVRDPNEVVHVPGTDRTYTRAQLADASYNPPDWFPNLHPANPPDVVMHGKPGQYQACALCHLPTGFGRPENSSINGLPVGYILEQMENFKNDLRHSSVPNMGLITMIPVAKNISPEDARIAAEYFASVKPTKYIRVVETNIVPKTRPNGRMLVKDEAGGEEPIGNRVIEVPEDVELVEMRNSNVGFVAYAPKGSVRKGQALAQKGDARRGVIACVTCHGPQLTGIGNIPPIAGRSPAQMARQIYDFKTGARRGVSSALMQAPVANLTDTDVVNLVAYLASLDQKH